MWCKFFQPFGCERAIYGRRDVQTDVKTYKSTNKSSLIGLDKKLKKEGGGGGKKETKERKSVREKAITKNI